MKKEAYQYLIKQNESNIEAKRVQQISALEKLLHKAQDKNDIKTELLIIQEINKASNLYVQKVETTAKVDAPSFNEDLKIVRTKLKKVN